MTRDELEILQHQRKLKNIRLFGRVSMTLMLLAIPVGILWGLQLQSSL